MDDPILIHIHDESRGMKRDFELSRSLLLRHMKYFKSFIPDPAETRSTDTAQAAQSEGGDIDISVHCDVYIFEVRERRVP